MARFKEARELAWSEENQIAFKLNAFTKYGEVLGEVYFNYVHGEPSTFEEQDQHRMEFTEAIVNALDEGTRNEKVKAVIALLSAVEEKTALGIRHAQKVHSGY